MSTEIRIGKREVITLTILIGILVVALISSSSDKEVKLSPEVPDNYEINLIRGVDVLFKVEVLDMETGQYCILCNGIIDSMEVIDVAELPLKSGIIETESGIRGNYIRIVGDFGELARYEIPFPLIEGYQFIPPEIPMFLGFQSNRDERKVEFYFKDEKIGEHVLTEFSCNGNGICEPELGENNAYCSSDCGKWSADRFISDGIKNDGQCELDAIFSDIDCTQTQGCHNNILDYEETGLDCGGVCPACDREDMSNLLKQFDRNFVSLDDTRAILNLEYSMSFF